MSGVSKEIERRLIALEKNSHPPVDLVPIIRELIREELAALTRKDRHMEVTKEATCPDADELAEMVRGMFAGGDVAGGITRPLSNGQRYYIVRESTMKADHDKLRAAQSEAAELREALEPVWHWYQSDEHPERPLVDIVRDMVCDLKSDRERLLKLESALRNLPKHKYWMPGEPDCPRELKTSNGELHTLRCKVCGEEGGRNQICTAAQSEAVELRGALVDEIKQAFRAGWEASRAPNLEFNVTAPTRCYEALELYLCGLSDRNEIAHALTETPHER